MLTKLKARVQEILTFEVKIAKKIGLTPNAISFFGLILAFLSALSYTQALVDTRYIYLAIATLLLSGFCDALDGAVARVCQKETPFGGFFDSLLDRYADAVVYAGILVGKLCDLPWGLAALTGSFMVSYSRARAEAVGLRMESIGIAERAERIVILLGASMIAALSQQMMAINAAIITLAVLSNFTAVQRVFYVYRKLERG